MSSHKSRAGSRSLLVLAALGIALVAPLASQGTPGHFYHVNYYQVRPGQEAAYDSALAHVVTPVLDEMVKRHAAVSYLLLKKVAGSGEYSNLVIVEVATPGTFQDHLDAATQATLHRSWDEATARFPELRRFVHTELYTTAGRAP